MRGVSQTHKQKDDIISHKGDTQTDQDRHTDSKDGNKMRLASDFHQQISYSTNNEQDSPDGNATVAQENGSTLISSSDEHQYCLKWNFHQNNQQTMFAKLLQQQRFVMSQLHVKENFFKHTSSYFEMILSLHEHQCPIIILKDVRFEDMSALIQFMYRGEIKVEQGQLQSLLETADLLKIKGLSDIYGKCLDEHSGFADKENSIGEPQDTKIDQ